MIIIRSQEPQPGSDYQYECIKTFSAHSVTNGGVLCIAFDESGQFVYSAGGDGSIMVHAVGGSELPRSEVPFENSLSRQELVSFDDIQPCPYD
jgi:WD40 repeat protein